MPHWGSSFDQELITLMILLSYNITDDCRLISIYLFRIIHRLRWELNCSKEKEHLWEDLLSLNNPSWDLMIFETCCCCWRMTGGLKWQRRWPTPTTGDEDDNQDQPWHEWSYRARWPEVEMTHFTKQFHWKEKLSWRSIGVSVVEGCLGRGLSKNLSV